MKPRSKEPGTKNIVGSAIVKYRNEHGIKQKDFLAQLQVLGLDISATSLSRLEGQYRLVQDYEVVIMAKALGITTDELLIGKRRGDFELSSDNNGKQGDAFTLYR